MKRQAQARLYHLLPVAFWLLATGGIVVWAIYHLPFTIDHYLPALLVLISASIIRRIPKHTDSSETCFVVALFLGVASYWLPSVVLMLLPAWAYLIYRNLFGWRPFLASLIGLATVAIWLAVLTYLLPQTFHLSPFTSHLSTWIPTAAVFLAWLGTTIVRQILRER